MGLFSKSKYDYSQIRKTVEEQQRSNEIKFDKEFAENVDDYAEKIAIRVKEEVFNAVTCYCQGGDVVGIKQVGLLGRYRFMRQSSFEIVDVGSLKGNYTSPFYNSRVYYRTYQQKITLLNKANAILKEFDIGLDINSDSPYIKICANLGKLF